MINTKKISVALCLMTVLCISFLLCGCNNSSSNSDINYEGMNIKVYYANNTTIYQNSHSLKYTNTNYIQNDDETKTYYLYIREEKTEIINIKHNSESNTLTFQKKDTNSNYRVEITEARYNGLRNYYETNNSYPPVYYEQPKDGELTSQYIYTETINVDRSLCLLYKNEFTGNEFV